MSVKQYKRRNEKRRKKEAKEFGISISTGRESGHYLGRSLERGSSGGAISFSRKKVRKLIATGEVNTRKVGKKKIALYFRDGRRIIVSENLKTVITYMD